MYNFFAGIGKTNFHMFNKLHITMIIILILLSVILFFIRNKLKCFRYKEVVRYIMGTILSLNMIIYYIGMVATNTFNIMEDLPLHLCFMTNFFMIYILFSGNKKLYKIIYFFTFIGPLPAIIWSDLRHTYDVYEFWQFIICHHLMLLTSLYLLFVLDYKVEFKDMFPAFLVGVIYVVIVNIGNNMFGTNYIMMTSLPENTLKLYPFLRNIPAIIPLFLVGMLAFLISYIPAYVINKRKLNETESKRENNKFNYKTA